MKFYLRYVNPLVAFIIFAICLWIFLGGYFLHFGSPSYADQKSAYQQGLNLFLYDAFSLYFLAKGIFCSVMLFLFGKFFEYRIINKNQ